MSVYQRNTLSNGLRVLTAPLDHAQSVACYIMLAAGSRYEDASNRGIAHFAEHMFFKGTERRPTARDLSMEVDKIGGEFNAFTSKEYTGYYIRCAGEQRDVALDVLVDMVRNSKFDSDELQREKGVIIEEMNMYFDTPRDYVGSMYEELLFGSNPLGWETLGTRDTVNAATRETFMDYIGNWYTPPRMVVGVAGMVGNDLIPTLEGLLGDMSGNGKDHPAPAEVVRTPEALVRVRQKDSDQANVCLGVPSYPLDHPDRYALQLLGTVLGTGMSSRLFLEVRERRGLAYYVYAYNNSYTDAGTLVAQAGVDAAVFNEAGDEVGPGGGGYLVLRRPWPAMLRGLYKEDERYRDTYWSKYPNVYFAGDGARIDEDADFWLLGRVDDVMNVSGHRISTIEVESALVDHQEVAEAAVAARSDATTGQAIVAFVTLKGGAEGSVEKLEELRNHVAIKIGAIAKPANIVFTPELPKTRSGKIMRRLLRDVAENRPLGDTTTLADPTVVDELRSREAEEQSKED
jgi:predicted Zn-dependent peptidase